MTRTNSVRIYCRAAKRAIAGDFNGTFPVSINDWGVVTGYYVDKNNAIHGFVLIPKETEGVR